MYVCMYRCMYVHVCTCMYVCMYAHVATHHSNHKFRYLLQQYDNPGRLLVVLTVGPDQTHAVEHGTQSLVQLQEVILLHLLKVSPQRLEVDMYVVGLTQGISLYLLSINTAQANVTKRLITVQGISKKLDCVLLAYIFGNL